MTIQIDSTTDTRANIRAAIGSAKDSGAASSEKPAPAQAEQKNATSASGPEATEANDDELKTSDTATDEAEDSADGDTDKDRPKRKSGFQRRIDKLNAAKAEAQRERDYWRDEALRSASVDAGDRRKESAEPVREIDGEPQPDQFTYHKDFVKALAAWTVKEERRKDEHEQHKSRVMTEHQQVVRSHATRVDAFAAKHVDFFDQIESLDNIHASAAMQEIITTSENGPEILYELAKDPKEAARIAALSPLATARELGKIESRFAAAASADDSTEPRKTTRAPSPPAPVTAKTGSVSKSIYDAEKMSQAEYETMRRKQRSAT